MVGWTEPKARIQHLFDTIPQAEVVLAWDAKARRFRAAYADPTLDVHGDLEELEPGMGLWVWLGGTKPLPWTRPMSPDATVDYVSLREGWNLVAWTGLDGVTAETALESIKDEFAGAMIWNAAAFRLVEYDPTASKADSLPLLRRGDALWVSAPCEYEDSRAGRQAVDIEQTMVFEADVP